MNETQLRLLIENNIPGKVIQVAIFFLLSWNLTIEATKAVKSVIKEFEDQSSAKRAKVKKAESNGLSLVKELEEDKDEVKILDFDNDVEYVNEDAPIQIVTKTNGARVHVCLR